MSANNLSFSDQQQDAVMALRSYIPDTAMTADLMGTERISHAIQVTEDGLMLTAGYSVLEANEVLITNQKGESCEAVILAQEFDSGIALVKPMVSLGTSSIETASIEKISEAEQVTIITSDNLPMVATVMAKEEFAGRWEYLLDEAIYTAPLCEHWSGAGLLNSEGKLVGIGSLALSLAEGNGDIIPGNMFIPVELIMEHLEHLSLYGEIPGTKRPWLGMLAEEQNSELHVIGIYNHAPAADAGIKPGDIILQVGTQAVATLPGFFRTLWHYGPAGSEIPLVLKNGNDHREVVLKTTDRSSFFTQRETTTLN